MSGQAAVPAGDRRAGAGIGALAAAGVLALALLASPSLHRYDATRMTNDEAMYAWKAQRIAQGPARVFDRESWRRHPPAVPALVALLAQALPIESAMSVVAKLSFAGALCALAAFAFRLAGPIAAGSAAVLFALHDGVREFAAHTLLDLPLVAVLGASAALWTFPGRRRWIALPLSALAMLVKSYGILVFAVFVACAVWERLGRRLRLAAAIVMPLGLAGVMIVGELGWLQDRFYWLAPHDPLRTGFSKLYQVVQAFQWLWPDARARTLTLLLVPVAIFTLVFARMPRARERILLAFLLLVPMGPLFVTRIVERRTLLLLEAPLFVVMGVALACAVTRIASPRMRTAIPALLLLCGVGLLLVTERVRPPADSCRYVGQFETAMWLRANMTPGARLYSTSTHQHRFYGGLEFEKDGGPLYGENEWTGVPATWDALVADTAARTGGSFLAIGWNQDTMPGWLRYDAETGTRLRDLGFAPAHETWLPANPACEPGDVERAAHEDAFFAALGSARVRTGSLVGEYLAGLVLAHRNAEALRTLNGATR